MPKYKIVFHHNSPTQPNVATGAAVSFTAHTLLKVVCLVAVWSLHRNIYKVHITKQQTKPHQSKKGGNQ